MNSVGGKIRLGHRRAIPLAVDLHGIAIDRENRGARLDHEISQGLQQQGRGVAVDYRS